MRRKRFLWVLGVGYLNLGQMVLDMGHQADEGLRYDGMLGTDEQTGDVCSDVHLLSKARQIRKENPGHVLDVVYCAGVNRLSAIKDVDEIELWETFNVNVMGFIRLMKVLVNVYGEDGANVVAVASDAARNAMRNSINYCASKAALVQAVRVAARELAPAYRINAISPAIIDATPMTMDIDIEVQQQRGWTEEEARAYERTMIPMGRRAEKYEVAQVILSTLIGPDFLTGSNIEITGGK